MATNKMQVMNFMEHFIDQFERYESALQEIAKKENEESSQIAKKILGEKFNMMQ